MDRRQAQDLDNWITGHYGEDQFRDDCPDNETAKQWTEESLAQAIAEEGLAFVVRNLNTTTQLLEALAKIHKLGLDLIDRHRHNWPVPVTELANCFFETRRIARAAIAKAEEATR